MDSAFQELDYSDISAKNINKKTQPDLTQRPEVVLLG